MQSLTVSRHVLVRMEIYLDAVSTVNRNATANNLDRISIVSIRNGIFFKYFRLTSAISSIDRQKRSRKRSIAGVADKSINQTIILYSLNGTRAHRDFRPSTFDGSRNIKLVQLPFEPGRLAEYSQVT